MYKLHSFCFYAFLALCAGFPSLTPTLGEDAGTYKQEEAAKDDYEKILNDQLQAMQELNGILKDVSDVDTATEKKPEIEKVATKMKGIKARADKLGKPDPETEKALKEKYEKQVQKEAKDLLGHIFRIGKDKEAAKIVQEALQKANG